MSESFDPYYRWLGIPPKYQPPSHYRLLGLELFEEDLEVIHDAAARQIAHVRTYQIGEYSDISQSILNELASAKACLVDHEKKAAYDLQLRATTPESAAGVDKPAAQIGGQSSRHPGTRPTEKATIGVVPSHPRLRGEKAATGEKRAVVRVLTDSSRRVSESFTSRIGQRPLVIVGVSSVALLLLIAITFLSRIIETPPTPRLAEIANRTVVQGKETRFTVAIENPDEFGQDEIIYRLEANHPATALINEKTGEFWWVPPVEQARDSYHVKLTVSVQRIDDESASHKRAFTIFVEPGWKPPPLPTPRLVEIANRTVVQGEETRFTVPIENRDEFGQDEIIYRLEAGHPATALINERTGEFRWVPPVEHARDVYRVKLTVSVQRIDDESASHKRAFIITVEPRAKRPSPLKPRLVEIANRSVFQGEETRFTVAIENPDEFGPDEIFYRLEADPPTRAFINERTGEFRWKPPVEPARDAYDVKLAVSVQRTDEQSASHKRSFTITVEPRPNSPPVVKIESTEPGIPVVGGRFVAKLSGTDPEQSSLHYEFRLDDASPWQPVNDHTVVINEVPAAKFRLFVRAIDEQGLASKAVEYAADVRDVENHPRFTGPPISVTSTVENMKGQVRFLAFNRDSTRLATGGSHGLIFWDIRTSKQLVNLKGTGHVSVYSALSPDGKTWASIDAAVAFQIQGNKVNVPANLPTMHVNIFDVDSGRELFRLPEQTLAKTMIYSGDGKILAVLSANGVQVVEVPSGRTLTRIPGGTQQMAFSADAKKVATAGQDQALSLWDAESGGRLRVIRSRNKNVWSAFEFSGDSQLLVSGGGKDDESVRIWDLSSGELLHSLRGHNAPILTIRCSPDGRTAASVSSDGKVRLWDIEIGREMRRLVGNEGRPSALAFNRSGTELAVASSDRKVRIWNLSSLLSNDSGRAGVDNGEGPFNKHPPRKGSRIWANRDGLRIRGDFVDYRAGAAWVRLDEFEEVRGIRLENLSAQDLEFVGQQESFQQETSEDRRVRELVQLIGHGDIRAAERLISKAPQETIRAEFLMGLYYALHQKNFKKAEQHFKTCARQINVGKNELAAIRSWNKAVALNNLAITQARQRSEIPDAVSNWVACKQLAGGLITVNKNAGIAVAQFSNSLKRDSKSRVALQRLAGANTFFDPRNVPGWIYAPLWAAPKRPYVDFTAIYERLAPMSGKEDTAQKVAAPGISVDLVYRDPWCLNCDGQATRKCSVVGCNGGKITKNQRVQIGINPVTGRPMFALKKVKVNCPTCKGTNFIACKICEGTGVNPAFSVDDALK